jgi:hypothetical protein
MSRSKRIPTVILILALLTSPAALAFYDVDSDKFDQNTGTGIAIIHVIDNIYAMVWYVDNDGNGQYSEGDDRIRTQYFRQ